MIDRRTFLRSTAGATTLGAAYFVHGRIAAEEHPDSELVALGAQFDRAFAVYKREATRANELVDAFRAKYGRYPSDNDPDAEAFKARYRSEVDPFVIASDEASADADKLSSQIRAIPAKTSVGVAVKARTLRRDLCKWGDDPAPIADWDWDNQCLEIFIRDLQAMVPA